MEPDITWFKINKKFYFGVFVVPVGEYLKSDKAHPYLISEQDRVAPVGTGPFKIGGNYGAVMKVQYDAKEQGYQDVVFLDQLIQKLMRVQVRIFLDKRGNIS